MVIMATFVALAVLVAVRWSPLIRLDQAGELAAHHDVLAHPWLPAGAGVATTIGSPLAVDVVTVVVGLILLGVTCLLAARPLQQGSDRAR
jgi:hypothetical protein